ncbi:hypothetical protein [Bradyrhizobium sp. S3.5.5]|uniref:hypothetical protein n=1 Tax=Bradyrhizobium sp. S3.5.5 TaxID=3156430 RepID=UPI00339855E3
MPRAKKKSEKAERPDGRKMTSMYLKPKIMSALKKRAIDEERNAYEIVEDALGEYLKRPARG